MRPSVEVDKAQLQRIQRNLSPQLYEQAMREVMQTAADVGDPFMKEAIRGGTEMAMQSISAKAYPQEARVFSMMAIPRGRSIEEGRQPGDAPGLLATARWLTGRRYLTARRLNDLPRDVINDARAAQASIRASGARGKRYLQQTRDKLTRELPAWLSRAGNTIASRWGGSS